MGASDSGEAGGVDTNLGFKVSRRKGFRIEMMGLGLDADLTPAPHSEDHSIEAKASVDVTHNPIPRLTPDTPQPKPKLKPRVRFGGEEIEPSHRHPVKHLGNTDW